MCATLFDSLKNEPVTLTVDVTAEDIKQGKAHTPDFCPIALAFKRVAMTPNVMVGNTNAVIAGTCFTLPKSASDFVFAFDSKCFVEPFTFTVTSEPPCDQKPFIA